MVFTEQAGLSAVRGWRRSELRFGLALAVVFLASLWSASDFRPWSCAPAAPGIPSEVSCPGLMRCGEVEGGCDVADSDTVFSFQEALGGGGRNTSGGQGCRAGQDSTACGLAAPLAPRASNLDLYGWGGVALFFSFFPSLLFHFKSR